MLAVAAVGALAVAGLGGCADGTNDLGASDEPRTNPPTKAQREPASQPAAGAPDPSPDPRLAALEEVLLGAVLTDEDVAGEGVKPVGPAVAPLQGCLARIPVGLAADLRKHAGWKYPTGSSLDQLVTAYPDRPAAEVLKLRVNCGGDELKADPVAPVDAHKAWCKGPACTIVMAKGKVLSAVQVTAGARDRAAEAVQRLAPIAATRLAGEVAPGAGGTVTDDGVEGTEGTEGATEADTEQ